MTQIIQQQIPDGWCLVALNDVAYHHSGNSKLIKGKLVNNPAMELYPAFSATGQDVWRDTYEHEGSAIIISAVGARCGKCFKASKKWSAIANTHIVWPIDEIVDRDFLWFKLNDENFWIKGGSAQPFVKTRESFRHVFPLPPITEQHRIVEKIETLFARLDKGEETLREVQKLLARYRQSVLKAAVTGQLTADWRAENAHRLEHGRDLLARILQTRRETWEGRGKYKEPATPDTTGLAELPEGWVWVSLDMLGEITTGSTPPTSKKDLFYGGEIPFLKPTDLDQGYNIQSAREFLSEEGSRESRTVGFGAVLVTSIGATTGKTGVCRFEKAAFNQQINAISPEISVVLTDYLYWSIVEGNFQAQIWQNAAATTLPPRLSHILTQLCSDKLTHCTHSTLFLC